MEVKYTTTREFSTFAWRVVPLLALAFCLTACIVIPLHRDSGYSRTNIDRHTPEQFAPGRTTLDTLILALGEPDAISADERHVAYRSEKLVGMWLVPMGNAQNPGASDNVTLAGSIYKNYFYVFDFDPEDRLQTVRETRNRSIVMGFNEPRLNPAAFVLNNSSNIVAAGGSLNAYWYANKDGFRKGVESKLGVPGELVLNESNITFTTQTHFLHFTRELDLATDSIDGVVLVHHRSRWRVVVYTDMGVPYSFEVIKSSGPGAFSQDKAAMQAAADFIQSRIKPTDRQK